MQRHECGVARSFYGHDALGVTQGWYMYCVTCGNCGRVRRSKEVADAEAALHERTA